MYIKQLNRILENHKHWVDKNVACWRSMEALLSGEDLSGMDLSGAVLKYADLSCVDFSNADLKGADLTSVDLTSARLCNTNLEGACLHGANLRYADLFCANLTGADLKGADLTFADLVSTNLQGAKNIPFIPYACPDTGAFTGFKQAARKLIVELEIPADARRLSATGRKCRCDKAKVISIKTIGGHDAGVNEIESKHDRRFIYRIGETVEVPDFDENRWNECGRGIHFFINRQEAVTYFD